MSRKENGTVKIFFINFQVLILFFISIDFLLYVYQCLVGLNKRICAMACLLEPIGQVLKMAVSQYMGSGTQIQVLCNSNKYS